MFCEDEMQYIDNFFLCINYDSLCKYMVSEEFEETVKLISLILKVTVQMYFPAFDAFKESNTNCKSLPLIRTDDPLFDTKLESTVSFVHII